MRQSQARLVVMYAVPAHDGDLMDHQISICGVVAGWEGKREVNASAITG
jgi:hypothetical protein